MPTFAGQCNPMDPADVVDPHEPKSDMLVASFKSRQCDPWLFMDRLELSAVSQASRALHELVCKFTPFGEVTRDVYAAPVPATTPHSLTVQWPCHKVLAADDVWGYFNVYGHVVDLDWLENSSDTGVETMVLYFDVRSGVTEAMKRQPHHISRESDGKKIAVKVFEKLSDNVVT